MSEFNEPRIVESSREMAVDDELAPLKDVPLVVSVELGRNTMKVRDLLQLARGSIMELTKLAGEPLDVYLHGRLVAYGEAVVINDQYGVRLTDIVGQRLGGSPPPPPSTD